MNLFDLFVKIGVKDEASDKIGKISEKLGNGLKSAAKIGGLAVSAAVAGISALTTSAIKNYSEYEQLVGGVETLFGAGGKSLEEYAASVGKSAEEAKGEWYNLLFSQQKVLDNAANAFKTAGMSANEYMSTVTSFSASLLQSVGGDTVAAADYANLALTDMSDNANKMGSSMETIQNAYQGFAKQNYTMLDNLKLGYGGTKEEMARLIADAASLSDTVDAQSMSFANIVEAIHVVQTEMGITGTTANEAATTIQGSVGMMMASWTNLVTGISDENANLDLLISNFVESVGITIGNILPKVHIVLTSAASLIEQLIPELMEEIPVLVQDTLPQILQAGFNIIRTILDGIASDPDAIVNTTMDIIDLLIDGITDLLPDLIVTGALLIGKLAVGLIEAIPDLIDKIPQIISAIVAGFKENSGTFSEIGTSLVEGFKKGISKAWSSLKTWFTNLFGDLIGIAKNILGIASPSKVFKKIGGFTAEGFGEGFDKEFSTVEDHMKKALSFDMSDVNMRNSFNIPTATSAASGSVDSGIGGLKIYLDSGALIGGIANGMDEALGGNFVINGRGALA